VFDIKEAEDTVNSFFKTLKSTPEQWTDIKVNSDSWSLKEIVGHLIDSASNNHQRFVRLQEGNLKIFPSYEQEFWVKTQQYNQFDWPTLLYLWINYNRLLLHIIKTLSPGSLKNKWIVEKDTHTLQWLIRDYYRHMRWHIQQYQDRISQLK
jgi:hypothetical protein